MYQYFDENFTIISTRFIKKQIPKYSNMLSLSNLFNNNNYSNLEKEMCIYKYIEKPFFHTKTNYKAIKYDKNFQ